MQKYKPIEEKHIPKWLNYKPGRMDDTNYMGDWMLKWYVSFVASVLCGNFFTVGSKLDLFQRPFVEFPFKLVLRFKFLAGLHAETLPFSLTSTC